MVRLLALLLTTSVSLNAGGSPRVTPPPLPPHEAVTLLTSPTRHVRALHPFLADLLVEGVVRSPTFAHLLADIERSDVIVQIVPSQNLPASTPARILLVPQPKTFRFLRIQMRLEGTDEDLITIMGHELHHALEIAAAVEVRDDRALAALYRRIGFTGSGDDDFDSSDAHAVERQVRRELRDQASRP